MGRQCGGALAREPTCDRELEVSEARCTTRKVPESVELVPSLKETPCKLAIRRVEDPGVRTSAPYACMNVAAPWVLVT
eukprot:scaffold124572_cov27-Tisochrysis_lutea.AAC.1